MPTLQLVGDKATNPEVVSVMPPDASTTGTALQSRRASKPHLDLTTQMLLRLAGEATAQGMRVQTVRLDDVSRSDSPELAEIQDSVVQELRRGKTESAIAILMNWPGILIITDLALRDDKVTKTVIHISRNGVISFGAQSPD